MILIWYHTYVHPYSIIESCYMIAIHMINFGTIPLPSITFRDIFFSQTAATVQTQCRQGADNCRQVCRHSADNCRHVQTTADNCRQHTTDHQHITINHTHTPHHHHPTPDLTRHTLPLFEPHITSTDRASPRRKTKAANRNNKPNPVPTS